MGDGSGGLYGVMALGGTSIESECRRVTTLSGLALVVDLRRGLDEEQPYLPEIVGTFLLAPLVLGLETWRRWGDLLNPNALDDWFVFVTAMLVARKLLRRDPLAPAFWVFVCGGAWFLFCLSLWGSIYWHEQGDPSGIPVLGVIAFKAFGVALISVASWRAVCRLSSDSPYD